MGNPSHRSNSPDRRRSFLQKQIQDGSISLKRVTPPAARFDAQVQRSCSPLREAKCAKVFFDFECQHYLTSREFTGTLKCQVAEQISMDWSAPQKLMRAL